MLRWFRSLSLDSKQERTGTESAKLGLGAISAVVDDSAGWLSLTARPHDYDPAQVQELYSDALTAWRKNPIAWRIIGITTDYVLGDGIYLSSSIQRLQKFLDVFWDHPQNRLDLRMEAMCDELARSGDLFIVLFRNQVDGMSYVRLVTKDQVVKIETAENDWENEIAYVERRNSGEEYRWLSATHPDAAAEAAIMLHYSVNRPAGALMGESDLTTMLPWLQRYSRMLEDRVRLNWAVRSFLWLVTVPSHMISAKREQYRAQPDTGSIIVKDEGENWQAVAPDLKAMDARYDMQAVRQMIDAGSGYPPHWRGEAGDANLATAQAMQGPTERHLLRRQEYFSFMLKDLVFHSFQRYAALGFARALPGPDYRKQFSVVAPEISRWDNESTARAARELATAFSISRQALPGESVTFNQWWLKMMSHFSGLPLDDAEVEKMWKEADENREEKPPSMEETTYANQ